jgi:uncharacterized protein (DUF342 family)
MGHTADHEEDKLEITELRAWATGRAWTSEANRQLVAHLETIWATVDRLTQELSEARAEAKSLTTELAALKKAQKEEA